MVLGNLFRGQFIDVIEWLDPTNDTMVYRFERHNNEIKFGAQLTVRESQVAVFVNEGQIADVFQPGRYVLETANVPILSTLQAWKHGFNSPFKAEVYFFNTKRFTDLKWGTKNAIMIQDPQLGPIEVRAFGTYEMRLKDAPTFMKEIVGTDGQFTTEEIANQLRNLIVTRFQSAISSLNVPFAQVAANNERLSEFLTQKIAPEFEQYGISLTKMLVENVSLPPPSCQRSPPLPLTLRKAMPKPVPRSSRPAAPVTRSAKRPKIWSDRSLTALLAARRQQP